MRISPERLNAIWYGGVAAPWWLRAGSILYACLRFLAQLPYRVRLRRAQKLGVPVIVVGNLSVGGTGKTPLTIALVEALRGRGFLVGVVSRGYGRSTRGVRLVDSASSAAEVGDEPLLIARQTRVPVAVGEDRVAAARRRLGAGCLDGVFSDGGLEHLALPRCGEIVVIDGSRGLGNGRLLPAGPLRAPLKRLRRVDWIVRNGGTPQPGEHAMTIVARGLRALRSGQSQNLGSWRGRRAHVVAGTGNPARVFASARALGIEVIEHPQPDHVDYAAVGVPSFGDGLPCLTTEKDAVKLPPLDNWYVLEVGAQLDPALVEQVIARIEAHLH